MPRLARTFVVGPTPCRGRASTSPGPRCTTAAPHATAAPRAFRAPQAFRAWLALLALTVGGAALGQDEDQRPRYLPGLIAAYDDSRGEAFERIEHAVSHRFDGAEPRLADGPLQVRWRGRLFAAVDSEYRLSARGAGSIEVRVNNDVVLQGELSARDWLDGKTVSLPFGRYPLEIRYAGVHSEDASRAGAVSLYWESSKFSREPIGAHFLLHDPAETIPDHSQRGADLVRGLRCQACHEIAGEPRPLAAPELTSLDGAVYPSWISQWLAESGGAASGPSSQSSRRMPHFQWQPSEIDAIVAALAPSRPAAPPPASPSDDQKKRLAAGKTLVHSVGCLACHQVDGVGGGGIYGGGDLTHIASKRPPQFFDTWLRAPEKLNADHRMPVFALSKQERSQIAAYLSTLGEPAGGDRPAADAELRREGRRLLARRGCVQCHQLGDARRAPPRSRLASGSRWDDSCLGAPSGDRPGYRLAASDALAVRTYISQLEAGDDRPEAVVSGRRLMLENNCTACHQRNGEPGLGPALADAAAKHPPLAIRLPALKPPSLNSVGDKLQRPALRETISRDAPRRREWLDVRMPKFPLNDAQLKAIVDHLVQQDRVPAEPPDRTSKFSDAARRAAGRRLVTADGFGCTSCHAVGQVKPSKAPINATGPDLAMLGQRIRKSWFDRWVRNPARIVPRMEMPSVKTTVRGVLHEDLEEQLDAVWTVLNTPGFVPPEPNPVRIVRHATSPDADAAPRPHVVTDVLHLGERVHVKPLLIGLANRQNLLYDLEAGRVRGWWTGDTARQHTKGKTWLWRPGAPNLLDGAKDAPELTWSAGHGPAVEPLRRGQFITEIEWLEFRGASLAWAYQLRYPKADGGREAVWITETIAPTAAGLTRRLVISGPPDTAVHLLPPLQIAAGGRGEGVSSQGDRVTIDGEGQWQEDGRLRLRLNGKGGAAVTMRFQAALEPVPWYPPEPKPAEPLEPQRLAVAPGFQATRLPLALEMMPTALQWRPRGELIIASLKGRVWQAVDADGDGLEDRANVFADDLAAPFGVALPHDSATAAQSIDLVGKYALLRLTDQDDDGRADRWERLASGWGHTADYHDWAVGLPQDEQGRYYLATACQQDSRSTAAAKWRGVVLRAAPVKGPAAGGRTTAAYEISVLSSGHRFPIGIARNRDGELFVTDNQGNYNPFNELNHVRQGRHYGFINKLQRKPGFKPPLTPPAINIPHPWTRSVNGICFLEAPSASRTSKSPFGPYAGHLIGCEYDTRRLIRMSLEEVAGVQQGAAYPLTREEEGGEPLLGPLCAAVSPRGELYVGCIRDSGWGGSNNIGTVVQLRPQIDSLPPGIAEVNLTSQGFAIQLQGSGAVDWSRAGDPQNYTVSSYRRVSTPAYGGPDVDRREESLLNVRTRPKEHVVELQLDKLQEGRVYELRLQNLAQDSQLFFPAEAYYTVRKTLQP